jgi:hypothetical protein
MESDPGLGDDRRAGHRYNAARAALLAAAGQDRDDPAPDEAEKAMLRGQAHAWLEAELAAWERVYESGPPRDRPAIVQALGDWKVAPNLAAIREPDTLAKLPEAERKAWTSLWAEVEALLQRARSQAP